MRGDVIFSQSGDDCPVIPHPHCIIKFWKVSNEVKGPAPFYDPKDYGDETYVRVTAEEARAGMLKIFEMKQ